MAGTAEFDGRGRSRWRPAVWGGAALLLLLPLAATQVSDEMDWDLADFILVGALLAAACGAWELAVRKSGNGAYRAAAGVAVVTAILVFLVNGAVGIIGSEDNPGNLLFLGAIAVAAAGSAVARFRARGMSLAMAAAAAAHVAAGVAGVILVPDIRGFLLGTALFTPMWLLAAWLFRKAG